VQLSALPVFGTLGSFAYAEKVRQIFQRSGNKKWMNVTLELTVKVEQSGSAKA